MFCFPKFLHGINKYMLFSSCFSFESFMYIHNNYTIQLQNQFKATVSFQFDHILWAGACNKVSMIANSIWNSMGGGIII